MYQKIKETGEKKLIYTDLTDTKFKFEFTPKSTKDNEIEIITEFESTRPKKATISVFTTVKINVIE